MKIKRYGTVGDMMEDYYQVRLTGYETRKTQELARLDRELVEFDAKARFLQAVLDGRDDLPLHYLGRRLQVLRFTVAALPARFGFQREPEAHT
jgi:hypothetical protein